MNGRGDNVDNGNDKPDSVIVENGFSSSRSLPKTPTPPTSVCKYNIRMLFIYIIIIGRNKIYIDRTLNRNY